MTAHIVDVLINLVAEHHHLRVALQDRRQLGQFTAAIHRAGGVAGRTQHHQPRARRDGRLQLPGSHLEALLHAHGHRHRLAAGQNHHLHVTHPCRHRDHNLVARVDEGHHNVAQLVLGTVADNHLRRLEVKAVLSLEFLDNSLAQRQVARHGGVEREIVVDGALGSLLDMIRSVKVRLAHREVNHVNALSLQLTALLAHRQRCARRQSPYSVTDIFHAANIAFLSDFRKS